MPDIRSIRNKARRDLHQAMKVPAYFYVSREGDAVPVTVRVHSAPKDIGDIQGTGFGYSTTNERTFSIIFLRDEVNPLRNSIVSVALNEAYRVDNVQRPDGITITAEVVPLSPADTAGLKVPDLPDNG
jgi:hypothetical protein